MIRLPSVIALSCAAGLCVSLAGGFAAGPAFAQNSVDPGEAAMNARKSHMQLYAHNLGVIGGMAQERIPYDGAAAATAAGNLVALASIDQTTYWLPGTDSATLEGSRALPALWDNIPDAVAKTAALQEAAAAMQTAAAVDLASLRGAMGALGGSCSACHENYRQPQ
jgi:cytochrome c556